MTLAERARSFRAENHDEGVTIRKGQLELHKRTELFAVLSAPLLLYVGLAAPALWLWSRILLVSMGVGVIVVDGWLLLQWHSDANKKMPRPGRPVR